MSAQIIEIEPSAYAAVRCHGDSVPGQQPCGMVQIDEDEYTRQIMSPNSLWCCPHCGSTATFDDRFFESLHLPEGWSER